MIAMEMLDITIIIISGAVMREFPLRVDEAVQWRWRRSVLLLMRWWWFGPRPRPGRAKSTSFLRFTKPP